MVYAYAWKCSRDDIQVAKEMMPNLGIILYPATYEMALNDDGLWAAFANSYAHMEQLKELLDDGAKLTFISFKDEVNADRAWADAQSPESYAAQFRRAKDILGTEYEHLLQPASIAGIKRPYKKDIFGLLGLRQLWVWIEVLLYRNGRFDYEYINMLPPTEHRLAAASKTPINYIMKFIEAMMLQERSAILVPAIFISFWGRLLSPVSAKRFCQLSAQPGVSAVLIWCLYQRWNQHQKLYQPFGLFDRHGNITKAGKDVKRYLKERG